MGHKKGIYIDGHERDDVVKYRGEFLQEMHSLQQTHQSRPPCSDKLVAEPHTGPSISSAAPSEHDDKKLVMIYNNESIFCTNEAQTWMWGSEDKPAILRALASWSAISLRSMVAS